MFRSVVKESLLFLSVAYESIYDVLCDESFGAVLSLVLKNYFIVLFYDNLSISKKYAYL